MPLECFMEREFRSESLKLIVKMNEIIDEYSKQGYALTLRQLYYQLVARAVIPNTEKDYDRTGRLLSDARLAGIADWDMIEDRGRITRANLHAACPSEAVRETAKRFMLDRWHGQEYHVELMIEKQALEGLIAQICGDLDIAYTANKGYSSSSALYRTGKRLKRKMEAGKKIVVLYLGDHDPSGMDMSRDVEDRIGLHSGKLLWDAQEQRLYDNPSMFHASLHVERIALNYDQVQQYNPPPNPTKPKDTRSPEYVKKFGYVCWELDALSPKVLNDLIENAVKKYRNEELWRAQEEKEKTLRANIAQLAEQTHICEQSDLRIHRNGVVIPMGYVQESKLDDSQTWYCINPGFAPAYIGEGHEERLPFLLRAQYDLEHFQEWDEGKAGRFTACNVDHIYGYWEVRGIDDLRTVFMRCAPDDARAKPFTILELG